MVIYEIQYSNDDYRKVKNPNIVNEVRHNC